MSNTILLYIASVVFLLLAIGLILTVYEFKTHILKPQTKKSLANKK